MHRENASISCRRCASSAGVGARLPLGSSFSQARSADLHVGRARVYLRSLDHALAVRVGEAGDPVCADAGGELRPLRPASDEDGHRPDAPVAGEDAALRRRRLLRRRGGGRRGGDARDRRRAPAAAATGREERERADGDPAAHLAHPNSIRGPTFGSSDSQALESGLEAGRGRVELLDLRQREPSLPVRIGEVRHAVLAHARREARHRLRPLGLLSRCQRGRTAAGKELPACRHRRLELRRARIGVPRDLDAEDAQGLGARIRGRADRGGEPVLGHAACECRPVACARCARGGRRLRDPDAGDGGRLRPAAARGEQTDAREEEEPGRQRGYRASLRPCIARTHRAQPTSVIPVRALGPV